MDPGAILAHLTLDDPSQVRLAETYVGSLPNISKTNQGGSKVHQVMKNTLEMLTNVMDGFSCPDPLFAKFVQKTANDLLNALSDPNLPLLELQEVLSSLYGRIPMSVETEINSLLTAYAYSVNSMFCTFPTQSIANVLDKHAATLKKGEDTTFFAAVTPVIQLIQKYRNGIRGHSKAILLELLGKYLENECLFEIVITLPI
eukprot:Awhi_evm1s6213